MSKTKYEILGLKKTASTQEIKQSYRRLAKLYHPDKNKEPNATESFRVIQEAYDTLSDINKKNEYDSSFDLYGVNKINLSAIMKSSLVKSVVSTTILDIFSKIKPQFLNENIQLELSFKEFHLGTVKTINLPSFAMNCSSCYGLKTINILSFFESVKSDQNCPTCKGVGVISLPKVINCIIEAGKIPGDKVVIKNGSAASNHLMGMTGDVIIHLQDKPNQLFKRLKNYDILFDMQLFQSESKIGFKKALLHVDEQTTILINSEANHRYVNNEVIRMIGVGLKTNDQNSNGDLFIKIHIV